jgi:hypothetical protein
MNLGIVVKWSFVISLVFELVGALMKIMHLPVADALFIIGMAANGIFRRLSRDSLCIKGA